MKSYGRFAFPATTIYRAQPYVNNLSNLTCLQATGLSKQVTSPEGELMIVSAIDLIIQTGETVAIVGASGSGKSTLLGLLAGLDSPSQGTVCLNGVNITSLSEDGRAAMRAGTVGFVFQSFQLLPSLTALENVMLPMELAGALTPAASAGKILKRVGLGQRIHHYPKQLSGGEQQRVAIARAFAGEPSLLFADEPTGNLDQNTGARIGQLLFELNREHGTTLLLVTHDPVLAEPCDRIIELDQGRIVTTKTAQNQ